jgi:probable phosphoglycerate mutase
LSLHVILARHGESVWQAENRYAGSTDIALTEHGHAQSRALADWAEQVDLSAIWTGSGGECARC